MTLQFRRGTDSDRLTITPAIGEPIYTTDTKSLYIGDGSTAGGTLVTGSGGVDSASTQAIIDSNIGAIGADLLPALDSTYDLGSASKKWKDLHLSGNSIFLGGHKIIKDGNTIKFTDSAGTTINVTAGNVASSLIDSSDVTAIIAAGGYTTYDSTNAAGQITTAINNLIDAAPASLDTLNELAAALNDDANFAATVTGQIAALPDSAQVATIVTSYGYTTYDSANTAGMLTGYATETYVDNAVAALPDSAQVATIVTSYGYTTYDSGNTIGLIDSAYINARADANLDSALTIALIDSAYVQARQTAQDFAYSSLTGAPNVLDSADVALIAQANDTTRDSAFVTGIIDSAYIAARTTAGTDSATVISLIQSTIDSAYVQLRDGLNDSTSLFTDKVRLFNYTADSGQTVFSGLTYTVGKIQVYLNGILLRDSDDYTATNGSSITLTLGTDLNDIVSVVGHETLPVAAATTITTFNYEADSGQTIFTGADIGGSSLTYTAGKLNVYLNGILLVDSNDYTATNGTSIVLNTAADSADTVSVISYITQQVGTLDSIGVTNLIDSAYIQARQVDLQRDSGFVTGIIDSAYINARVSATDSATVSAIITADVDAAFINALTIGADSLGGQAPSYYLDYNNFTNTPSIPSSTSDLSEGTNLYYTTARHDSDFDARLSGGTGVTVSSGQVSIGQAVGTTDSVQFNAITTTGNVIIGGNLQVTGTTTTVNSEDLNVTDHMIYMNAGESAGSPTASIDVGWAANVNDNGSYTHVGMFRDATDDTFKVFGSYALEPDSAAEINTGHASFALAPFAASTLTGQYQGFDSDVTAAGLATQTYVDNAIAALPDSAQVATIITSYGYSTFDSTNATGLITSYGYTTYDSTNTLGLIDSAYIQARQVDLQRDSGFVTGIIDSAYINARVTASGGTDSATVISLIQSTVDSAYVALRDGLNDSSTYFTDKVRFFEYTADSGQTTFTGLKYTPGKQQVFLNGILLIDSADYTATTGNTIVLQTAADLADTVAVVGYETLPTAAATTISNYYYTADSGQTTFTGADDQSNTLSYTAGKLQVYLNGILLKDSDDYTATNGTSIVLTQVADLNDVVSVNTYVTQRVGLLDSAEITQLIDSAYIAARVTTGTDSATVLSLVAAAGYTTFDSTNATNLITSYGYTTFDSGNASGLITTAINNLVDAAPASLDTLNELAAALNDDANFAATITGQIAALPDSAQVATIVTSYGYSTYDSTNAAGQITSYGYSTYDSGNFTGQLTSATGTSVLAYDANLQGFVDAFTLPTSDGTINQVLVTNGSGTISFADQSGGLDSALITQLIDSAYVQARQTAGGGTTQQAFKTISVSGQSDVVADDSADTLTLVAGTGITLTTDAGTDTITITASGGGGGGLDSAATNTLIDAKIQVLDVTDLVGTDGNAGQLLKSLGNGETEWTDLKLSDYKPASATATGSKGEITYDSAHLYVCIATNTWRRIIWTDSSW